MGACCSCFCCPICTACGTACSVPCATCCDYGGLAWLERDSTLALSLASLLLGLCLHLVMTIECAALHDTSWSPLPTHYENGPCFGSGGGSTFAGGGGGSGRAASVTSMAVGASSSGARIVPSTPTIPRCASKLPPTIAQRSPIATSTAAR